MLVLQTTRRRWSLPLAALLLGPQALGGGAVALAHTAERVGAPVAFEAHHTASCPVVHDAAGCALCQYAGLRVVPARAVVHTAATSPAVTSHGDVMRSACRLDRHLPSPPRAPPFIA